MKSNRFETYLSLLSLISFILWLNQKYNLILTLSVFLFLFLLLFLKKKPLEYFLVVSLFSVVSISNIKSIKIDAVLIILLFVAYLLNAWKKKKIVIGHLLVIILIQFSYAFISITYTYITKDGFVGLSAIVQGYMIYFIVTNSDIHVNKTSFLTLAKIASFFMFTVTLEIFVLYFTYGLKNILLDKDLLHLGWGLSNTVAVIYVFLLPLSLWKYKNQYKLMYIIMDSVNFIGFALTLSRGAYVGFICAFFVLFIYRLNKAQMIKWSSILFIITFILFIIKSTRNIIWNLGKLFYYDSHRLLLYKLAYQSFFDKMLFGHGLKSSRYLIHTYTDQTNSHFHNFLLQTLATLGIIGFVFLIIFFIRLAKILHKTNEVFIECITCGIVGELVHQLFDISFNKYFFGIIFYLLISFVELYRNQHHSFKMKILRINKDRKLWNNRK